MFLYVSLGTVVGRIINPINAGLLPKWVTLLKIATFELPSTDFVAIRFADLYPVQELIKFSRSIFSIWEISSLEMCFICFIYCFYLMQR
jgi:hypothetical protein